LPPKSTPPTAAKTKSPWPIKGAGTGCAVKVVSGPVPKEIFTLVIIVEVVTPDKGSVKVAGPST